MKKRICILLAFVMVTLSACGTNVNVNVQSADKEAVDETKDEVPEETEPAGEAKPQEDSGNEKLPVYKLVYKYYDQKYSGKEKEDGAGNKLEGKKVFEGLNQVFMVADESKDLYPELYKSLNDDALAELKNGDANAEGMIEQAGQDADSSKADGRPFYGPYTDYLRVSVTRADAKVFSYCQDYSNYMGGAHGMYGRSGYNYDVATGKKLDITDIADVTEDQLIPVIKEKLLQLNEPEAYDDLDEKLADYKLGVETQYNEETDEYTFGFDWYLDFDGIHFYFGPYEIAAYATGASDVLIGYDEFPGKIKEEYLPDKTKGYIVASDIPMNGKSWDDENDKSLHFVYDTEDQEYNENDEWYCTSLTLKRNGKSATAEDEYFTYSYDKGFVDQYRVVTADGKEYIYVCALSFDDFTDIMVFDITGDDVRLAGVTSCERGYADVNTDNMGKIIFTDPENICLGDRCDMLGTFSCQARYVVGADGMPELADKDFSICWVDDAVKSLKDIKVTSLDANYEEQGEETLPSGSLILPVRTDMRTYIDCRLDDGKLIRLKYDSIDYPAKINGESVEDLFDGLTYAG